MKAPEKIYLQKNTTTDCYEEFYPEWFETRARKSDIEYTRTDAFIEKTCKLLENIFHDRSHHSGRGDAGEIVTYDFDSMEEFILKIRKVMKEQ